MENANVKVRSLRTDSNQGCVIFVTAYLATFVFQIVLSLIGLEEELFTWIYAFGAQAIFILVAVIGHLIYKVNPVKAWGLRTPPSISQTALVIPIALFAVMAFAPLAYIALIALNALGYNPTLIYPDYLSGTGAFFVGIVGLCVMPALGEEMIVRGSLANGLKGKGYLFGIIFSALMFALMHGNATQLVHQFLIGCTMAYLFYLTGSLYVSMFFHFLNNLFALLLDLLLAKSTVVMSAINTFNLYPTWEKILIYIAISLVGIVILFFLLVLYNKVSIKKYNKKTTETNEQLSDDLNNLVFADDNYKKSATDNIIEKGKQNRFLSLLATFPLALKSADKNSPAPSKDEKKGWNLGMGIAMGLMVAVWLVNVIAGWIG